MSSKRVLEWDTRLGTKYRIPIARILAIGQFLLKYNIPSENVRIVPRRFRRCKVYIITDDGFIRRWSLSQRRLKFFPYNESVAGGPIDRPLHRFTTSTVVLTSKQ